MKKVVLRIQKVENIKDLLKIEKELKKEENIKSAYIDLKTNTIAITGNKELEIEKIEKRLETLGCKSQGVELVSNSRNNSLVPLAFFGIILGIILYVSLAMTFHLPMLNILSKKARIIGLGIITIVFLFYGSDILIDGIKKNIKGRSNLNTLVTFSILISFLYSIWNLYMYIKGHKSYTNYSYLEGIIFLIYFMKIGSYIDGKNKKNIEEEINQISKTTISKVNKKAEDSSEEISIEEIKIQERVICLPGDRVLLDGMLVEGSSHFDESLVTGGSFPIEKKKNSKLLSGSVNCENEIEYIIEKDLKDSYTSEMKKLVVEEQNEKRHGSKRMDRFCNYFVPIVVVFSIIILILNYLITKNVYTSITKWVTLLLISCPFGFAFATPLSFQKSLKQTSKKGLLIKNIESLEQIRRVDTIVFDKTGTLTNGYLSIDRINNHSDMSDKELLELLESIEKHSTHALARGITKYLRSEKIKAKFDFLTEDLSGYGVKAKDEKDIYYACNGELLEKLDIINSYKEEERKLKLEGNSVIYLVKNNKVIATFGLKDVLKKEAKKVVNNLKEKGLEIILLTGDNEIIAKKIARELEIDSVLAGVNAVDKKEFIRGLLKEGKRVVMVGDGINDAPSLAASTIGITIKGSTDIPISAADVIITNNNLFKILDLFLISKSMLRHVKQNITISLVVSLALMVIALGIVPGIEMNALILIVGMFVSAILVSLNMIRVRNK